VIGGVKELTGEEYGVYVKRILPGGLASSDGKFSQRYIFFCLKLPLLCFFFLFFLILS